MSIVFYIYKKVTVVCLSRHVACVWSDAAF